MFRSRSLGRWTPGRGVYPFVVGMLILFATTTIQGPKILYAQTSFGTILGNVTDPSQASIPEVTITVTNTQTGIARQTKTDQSGNYTVGSLLPGIYDVKAEHAGFQVSEMRAVGLPVVRTITINIQMQLGAVTQTVQVTGTAPLLDTATATVGTVVNNQNVVTLPLNGRAFTDLLLLVPGSVPQGGLFTIAGGHQFSVSGNPSDQNNFTLDGVANNEAFFKQFAIQPSIDAIQEFRVQTNITAAEYGQGAGANVNVALKAGTNTLHGAGFEFLRNDKLDAVDWFRNYNSTPTNPATRPAYKRNQYGGVIAGPVYIPKVYNGRERAFWMFNYEALKIRRAATAIGTIPTTTQLSGDLRDQPPIYDPFTTTQVGTDEHGIPIYARQQLSCNEVLNVICRDRIDPYIAAWIPIGFPAPANVIGGGNVINTSSYTMDQYQVNIRADYKIKDNLNFFARYSSVTADEVSPQAIKPYVTDTGNHYRNAVASWTWVESPTTVVDFKAGVNRTGLFQYTPAPPPGPAALLAAHPLQGTGVKNPTYPEYPQPNISGYTTPFQQGVPLPTNDVQGILNISMVRGRHTFKTGALVDNFRGSQDNFYGNQFGFDSIPTTDPQHRAGTGSALASFLLGLPSGGNRNIGNTLVHMRWGQYQFYVQDDLKLTRRLTFNLGLRYEWDQSPRDPDDRQGMFDRTSGGHWVWAGKNPVTGEGPNVRRAIRDPDFNNFAPRLGFAYQANPKTALRSGYAIFYAPNQLWEVQGIRGQWPYALSENPSSQNTAYPDKPIAKFFPAYMDVVPETQPSGSFSLGRLDRTGYMQQWNLGVQRELAKDLLLEVDYVANKGNKLSVFTTVNSPPPGPGVIGSPEHPRPFPQMANASSEGNRESMSSYQSMQVKLEKRFSSGLQFLGSYAWAKFIDTEGTGTNNGAGIQDYDNRHANRGPGSFDYRHIFTGSYFYQLPFGRGKRFLPNASGIVNQILGGWEVTGITHFTSGNPLGVGLNFDNSNSGRGADRPNRVLGQPARVANPDKTQGWLNPAAFSIPPQYTYGNLGRNTEKGPGFGNWDLGLYKNFPLHGEKQTLQFRTEFFNAFNNVNLGGPDGSFCTPLPACNPSFGQIFSTQNPSREIQFALKFLF